MRKEKALKSASHNKLSPVSFAKLFVVLEIVSVFFYMKYGATFSVYGTRLRNLIIIAAFLGVGSLVLSIKRERNWISLFTGVCIPVLSYEAASMFKYSVFIQRVTFAGIIIAFFTAALCGWIKIRKIKKTRIRNSILISRSSYLMRILCLVLLIPVCIYGKVLINSHYTISMSDIEYLISDTQNDVPDYDNSLDANMDMVVKMDPYGGWENLSPDEKMDVLQVICRIECRYLGMRDSAPSLELAYLEEGLLGQYDHEADKITLSYNYVIDTKVSAYSICQVLLHEMYHRYQHYQVNMLEAIRASDETSKYANLLLLDDASIYEDEINNYIAPTENSEISYYIYYSQRLERDAERYANEAVSEYYDEIQEYLGMN